LERLGRYELLEELGRGAMGVVYKARDPEIDRLVAVKVLAVAPGLDPGAAQQHRERFQREARAAGRLAHPNIVTIHDVGEDQGRTFLVMQLVEGQALDRILRTRRPLPLAEALTIGEQVASALDYAHRHGIIHRDVKPANILLSPEGSVKVTDFGIARITGAETTQAGQTLGTPSYMSPEQVQGLTLDGRSDIFSLGTVLYEVLSGERAFQGETLSTIIYRILHEEPIPLRQLNPAFPEALETCLQKALAKDPGARFARATDLARDLRTAAEGKTVSAPADIETRGTLRLPTQPPSPPHGGRRRLLWPALTAGIAAVAVAIVLLAVWGRASRKAERPAAPPIAQAPVTEAGKTKAIPDEAVRKKTSAEAEPAKPSEERARTPGAIQRRGADDAEMVYVPAGTFVIGDTHGDGEDDERPTHPITLPAFWLDRTEVTNAQFAHFARFTRDAREVKRETGVTEGGKDRYPVVNVPWRAALAYCRWAGKRLPTEAEWEYAARGSAGRKYPWGNTWDERNARFAGNHGSQGAAPVGSYPAGASPFGALDMAGNVWEWVSTLYMPYPYLASDGRENLSIQGRHVLRGGSWFLNPWDLRSSNREFGEPGYRSVYIGFRCAQG
jgi:serine/threonine-protein kinase